jgi:hypothetical protein
MAVASSVDVAFTVSAPGQDAMIVAVLEVIANNQIIHDHFNVL